MTVHIGAEAGEIAETVLLPGDPLRARWAAETFLQGARQVNGVRGMLGYTGTWNGHPVTIHGTGMGMPSMSIYAGELIRDFGARRLIRVGSCGAMQDGVRLRDIVLAMSAASHGTPSQQGPLRAVRLAPCADWELLQAAARAAGAAQLRHHVGAVYTSDAFYGDDPATVAALTRHGVLAVEMETAELYTLAARHGVRALAVLTVSDHLPTAAALPAAERETGFAAMIRLALESAFA